MGMKKSNKESMLDEDVLKEVLATLLFTLGLFSTLSLIFFSADLGFDLKGTMGNVGLFISQILGYSFGVCSFIFPVLMFYLAYVTYKDELDATIYGKLIAGLVFLISTTSLLGLIFNESSMMGYSPAGGWIGTIISGQLTGKVSGTIGSYVLVTILSVLSLIILTGIKLRTLFNISNYIMGKILEKSTMIIEKIKNIEFRKEPAINNYQHSNPFDQQDNKVISFQKYKKTPEPVIEDYEDDFSGEPQIIFERHDSSRDSVPDTPKPKAKINFKLPPIDLLDPKIESGIEVDKNVVYEKARLIENKLEDFGVKGKVTQIRPGPVITMFEYKPAPGIKINKISSLENDLAMGLSAVSIRIIAPIPGKDVIGIEVPNAKREIVVLRELLEDSEFKRRESILTLALGKDISGKPYYMNLRTAPHLMIAGTTGSGKSVLLNAVLTSLIYKSSPHELKFIMIDPKMLELSIYEDIPHLLHPVVTEPRKAAAALKWAVDEMESRYKLLSEQGVRDIESHNKSLEGLSDEEKWDRWLPYIVIVLDELADLMMVAPTEIKESITRLSQKARAAGIHIIVATQRPSVDVVAGLLKANFPARISFLVSSKVDSRIILDTGGAESLLGKGDMLFLQPGTSTLVRLQGALISDKERELITDYLREQGRPQYIEEITFIEEGDEEGTFDDEKDELYETALRIIAETKQASISMLQRRLKIGYNRSARIVEIMEKEGVIGPQESAGKPRDVYIDINQVKETQTN